jgi:4-aminobutyrate aminotransferase / (S)-3-amino-2-methylpropionate transaminase / 5-aminovalerate transaminase
LGLSEAPPQGGLILAGHGFSHVPKDVGTVSTDLRRIVTPIPAPESIPLLERLYAVESHSMHGQLPVVWDRAEGFQVFDAWGNCWIDFTSTIFVANAGHGNPRIVEALRKVLDKPLLHTYTYATRERLDFIDYLIQNTPEQFEKAFLLSAGTEATECAFKLMRENGRKRGKRRGVVLCFEGNWHGRTLGAQMMGWSPQQKEWIGYLDPNIHHLPFPYPWRDAVCDDPVAYFHSGLEHLLADEELDPDRDLCGIMFETFQGWGAVFYPPAFVQAAVAFAHEHEMLVAFDEMQAGFGRTGSLFGYEHYGVKPDLLCCGKGASSSLPLSIVLGAQTVMDLPEIGSMSSTHSANPMVCAAGKANLEALLEDGLIDNARVLGQKFHASLRNLKDRFPEHISSVQGVGMLAALLFNDPDGRPLSALCDRIAECCMQRGLLVVHTGRESIKLAPPLCITEDALKEGMDVLEQTIADCILGEDDS